MPITIDKILDHVYTHWDDEDESQLTIREFLAADQDFFDQYEEPKKTALYLNAALDLYVRAAREWLVCGRRNELKITMQEALEAAKFVYGIVHKMFPGFVFYTDFECAYGEFGSPWIHKADTPEDFVIYQIAFDAETDEASLDFQNPETLPLVQDRLGYAVQITGVDLPHARDLFAQHLLSWKSDAAYAEFVTTGSLKLASEEAG